VWEIDIVILPDVELRADLNPVMTQQSQSIGTRNLYTSNPTVLPATLDYSTVIDLLSIPKATHCKWNGNWNVFGIYFTIRNVATTETNWKAYSS
jgi:hypothetical protein